MLEVAETFGLEQVAIEVAYSACPTPT